MRAGAARVSGYARRVGARGCSLDVHSCCVAASVCVLRTGGFAHNVFATAQASVLRELEAERVGLRQRAEARRASLVERRQQRAAAVHEGREGGAAVAGAEEEAEDHEVLQGER